ncbi:hypothetical protein ACT3S2_14145 [Arthrobacter sp. AOP36-A1-22]|uniref:hypothetical protein n=1 Tax=Arthrobacter sp. AOP36-A1-22 TaxID=3457684 RepID=UPI0040334EB7
MTTGVPLPPAARRTVFLIADALNEGASRQQLRRKNLMSPSRGILQWTNVRVDPLDVYRAFSTVEAGTVLSHVSAAHAWGIWLDARFVEAYPVHLTCDAGGTVPRRRNVVGHGTRLSVGEALVAGRIRLTSPARTWVDLASIGLSVRELVVAGDALLQRPDGPPQSARFLGTNPLTTLVDLRNTVHRRSNAVGIQTAREALELLRPGVDSAPETHLRWIIRDARYPEPGVNLPVLLPDGRRLVPDLQFAEYRIAVQYEGKHHGELDQIGKDIGRDFAFTSLGWITVKADRAIFHAAGRECFLERLAAAFRQRGITSPQAAWSDCVPGPLKG